MEEIPENMCKQACLYVFVQENYVKVHVLLIFSPFSAHFYPLITSYRYKVYSSTGP